MDYKAEEVEASGILRGGCVRFCWAGASSPCEPGTGAKHQREDSAESEDGIRRGGPNNPDLKRLSKGEIKKLQDAGEDPHDIKKDVLGGRARISQYDLFKDEKGNIFVNDKKCSGEPQSTGLNINSIHKDDGD